MALITAAAEEGSSGLRWGGVGVGGGGEECEVAFRTPPPPPPPPGLYKHLTATEGSLCAFSLV